MVVLDVVETSEVRNLEFDERGALLLEGAAVGCLAAAGELLADELVGTERHSAFVALNGGDVALAAVDEAHIDLAFLDCGHDRRCALEQLEGHVLAVLDAVLA